MAKLHTSLCALAVLSVHAAYAQEPSAFPAAPIAQATPPAVPAPIEPPIQVPGSQQVIPPAVGETLPPGTTVVPGVPVAPGTLPDAPTLAPGAARLNDFQGDPIDLVLRTLARQAKINLVVSE